MLGILNSDTLSNMTLTQFETLVFEALMNIPDEIRTRLENIDVVVEEHPTSEQLTGTGIEEPQYLLGLYEGIPLGNRYGYNMVLPDKITLFMNAIVFVSSNTEDMVKEIQDTVIHEVAHHFGINDERLVELGL